MARISALYPACVLCFCCCFALSGWRAHAQNAPDSPGGRNQPLEITADDTLEWKRTDQIFVARKNAVATQGETSIRAEALTAHYREGSGAGMEIWRIQAEGRVEIRSRDSTAYGERAEYNIDRGLATLTGDGLEMTMPGQAITAQERFEYWVAEGRLNALGAAKLVRTNPQGEVTTLEADKISAVFKNNQEGKRALHTLEAIGNVVITTPAETVTGDYGMFRADKNIANLKGGVTITRGPNVLKGERAEVDLNTNVSRMFGGESGGGRVRGVFYPDSAKTPE